MAELCSLIDAYRLLNLCCGSVVAMDPQPEMLRIAASTTEGTGPAGDAALGKADARAGEIDAPLGVVAPAALALHAVESTMIVAQTSDVLASSASLIATGHRCVRRETDRDWPSRAGSERLRPSDRKVRQTKVKFRKLATMKRGRWAVRYGVAAAVMLTAIALTRIPLIGPEPVIFLTMFFSAWYGGIGPGLFATLLFEAIIVGMRMQAGVPAEPKFIRDLVLIFFVGAACTLLMESLHGARRRAEASRQWLSAVLTSIGDAVIADR